MNAQRQVEGEKAKLRHSLMESQTIGHHMIATASLDDAGADDNDDDEMSI